MDAPVDRVVAATVSSSGRALAAGVICALPSTDSRWVAAALAAMERARRLGVKAVSAHEAERRELRKREREAEAEYERALDRAVKVGRPRARRARGADGRSGGCGGGGVGGGVCREVARRAGEAGNLEVVLTCGPRVLRADLVRHAGEAVSRALQKAPAHIARARVAEALRVGLEPTADLFDRAHEVKSGAYTVAAAEVRKVRRGGGKPAGVRVVVAVPGSKARLYPAAMLVGAVLDKDGKEIGGVSIDSVYDRTAMRAIEMAREMGDIPGVASEHELTVGTRVSIAVEKKVVAEGLQAVRPAINPPWRRSKAG